MARRDVSTLLNDAECLVRETSTEDTFIAHLNFICNDMATRLQGTHPFQTLVTQAVSTAAESFSLTSAATNRKYISVVPRHLVFTTAESLRYSPRRLSYAHFRDKLLHQMKGPDLTGVPEFWSYTLPSNTSGTCTVLVYPKTHQAYTVTALVNFKPHPNTLASEYPVMPAIAEHVVMLGTSYLASRMLSEKVMLDFRDEYERGIDLLRKAAGQMDPEISYGDRTKGVDFLPGHPYIRLTGTEPVVAFDDNPAIPYDPADP